ncbi:triose-phosphate isomerase [Jatrophihabitans sp. YIM 134969]
MSTPGARRPLVAGNWKMNLNHLEAIAHAQKVAHSVDPGVYAGVDVAVLPPFTDLRSVQTLVDGDKLALRYGAQDLSPHASGAYTGDVSGPMLAKLGCTYVTVGHSERRAIHGETDDIVNAKARAAITNGIVPILCVGEPLEIRETGEQVAHCSTQLALGLVDITEEQVVSAPGLVIAYEPVWAIGTGRTATPEDAQEVCSALRAQLAELYSPAAAAAVRIVYGGSMNAGNAAALTDQRDVDGGLIGGASLDAEAFAAICRAALR